eukprot:TRINITY_DN3126_c0_g1_i1.p1 TRINITY_DN3126_c0_g1~~TRINITY_DN3126_c0_g1_i1.p1  ORF type:complete len:844 (-),score=94.00 TRINITY_DN3126_c0_g1_i1:742-3273(-)
MSELIRKLQESLGNIEKCLDESIGDHQTNSAAYRSGRKAKVMAVYLPERTELKPADLRRIKLPSTTPSESIKKPSMKELHELFETVHSLSFAVDKSNTFKDLEKFLKKRVRSVKDIAILKGSHYYILMKQQAELKAALGESTSLEEFIEEQEHLQEMEELVHTLGKTSAPVLEEQQKEGMAPPTLHFEKSKSATLSSKPLAKDTKKRTQNEPRIGFKFFCGGAEIKNKEQPIFETVLRPENRRSDMPYDIQGLIAFQLCEKPRKLSKKIKAHDAPYEPCVEEKGYVFKHLSSEEQHVLSLCQVVLNFDVPQIRDPHTLSAMKLLKLLYHNIKTTRETDKTSAPYLSHIREEDFINPKVEQLVKRHFQEPSVILSGSQMNDDWAKALCYHFPFMIHEKTRLVYFKLSMLDRDRALLLLMQTIKGNGYNKDLKIAQKRIKLKVNRENILDCGMSIMQSSPQKNYLLEFDFADEVGSGLGPTLEFYSLSALALRSLAGLWRPMENGTLFPAPLDPKARDSEVSKKIPMYFKYMGWLVARTINDERLIDLPFSEIFWDLILGRSLTLVDIARIDRKNLEFFLELERIKKQKQSIENDLGLDPEQKKRQIESIRLDNGCKVSDLALTFVLQGYDNIELKHNGSNIPLTLENIAEYLDLTAHYTLYKTIVRQLTAFKEGFNLVFPIESLQFFKSTELEDLICGDKVEQWDVATLQENITPVHGYDKASPQYKYFLQYLASLPKVLQRLFLQYVTGSPRLPVGGFAKLSPKLTVAKRITPEGDHPDVYLPSVMTCQNYLKIPEYSTYQVLKEKFDYALNEGQNSFTLSQIIWYWTLCIKLLIEIVWLTLQ